MLLVQPGDALDGVVQHIIVKTVGPTYRPGDSDGSGVSMAPCPTVCRFALRPDAVRSPARALQHQSRLAPIYIRNIFAIVREINRKDGVSILLVEQNAHHALRLAHRAYVLQHGSIVLAGTGNDLLNNPEVKSAYLAGGQPHAARAEQPRRKQIWLG
jgi:hypothetical protein